LEKIPVFIPAIDNDTLSSIDEVLKIGWLGMGAKVKEFEDRLNEYFEPNDRYLIATNTATSALHLGLRAIGIGKGDEVITPSFNCVADQQAIRMAGAEPVMCDIKDENLGIDCKKAEELISESTKAIIPLHYAGIPCDQKGVYEIAKKYNLRVLEDCCHAFGTTIDNKKLGSYGDIAFFSFDAVKTITSIDGGCIITSSEEEMEKIQHMRLLGMNKDTLERYKNRRAWDYDVDSEGYRYHMNNVLASVGISQLEKIDSIISSRRDVCIYYNTAFENLDGLMTPKTDFSNVSPFIYTVRVMNGKRDELIEHLKNNFIDTGIHWKPVHKFSYFSKSRCGDLSITNKVCDEILTLPLHSNMKTEYVKRVVEGVTSFYRK